MLRFLTPQIRASVSIWARPPIAPPMVLPQSCAMSIQSGNWRRIQSASPRSFWPNQVVAVLNTLPSIPVMSIPPNMPITSAKPRSNLRSRSGKNLSRMKPGMPSSIPLIAAPTPLSRPRITRSTFSLPDAIGSPSASPMSSNAVLTPTTMPMICPRPGTSLSPFLPMNPNSLPIGPRIRVRNPSREVTGPSTLPVTARAPFALASPPSSEPSPAAAPPNTVPR